MSTTLFMRKVFLDITENTTIEDICDQISSITNDACEEFSEHWRFEVSIDYRTIVKVVEKRFKTTTIPLAVIRGRRGNERRSTTETIIFSRILKEREDEEDDEKSVTVPAES